MAHNTLTKQRIIFKCSNSSGIKKKKAAKIDAALKAMKWKGNASMESEAQSEGWRFFEYDIAF